MSENEYRTKTGKVLTDADIQALADEAERGYDVEHLKPQKFNRRERNYLDILQRRLEYLREQVAERGEEGPGGGYIAGELKATAWALSALGATVEPVEIRIERIEQTLRNVQARVGRIEKTLDDEEVE